MRISGQDKFQSIWLGNGYQCALEWANRTKVSKAEVDKYSHCNNHNCKLEIGQTRIKYGKPSKKIIDYLKWERQQYPNYISFVLGGCALEKTKVRDVLICPMCRNSVDVKRHIKNVIGTMA